MTDQFIGQLPRRRKPNFCVFLIILAFAAGWLTAYLLHGNTLELAKKIARAESLRVADLQTEVARVSAMLTAEQRKNYELLIRLDAVRQPLADIADLTAAVHKLTMPTLSPHKHKTVPAVKLPAPQPNQPLKMIPVPKQSPVPLIKRWPEQMTAAHNKERAAADVPPLAWDNKLAQDAAEWAMQLAQMCQLKHSGGSNGENLFWSSVAPDSTDIVNAWASEQDYYDHETRSCAVGKTCGHYTQIMWKSTKKMGCALAKCKHEKGYISVCKYEPAGNWAGERPF
jgi:pathogenesis-related protein 1